MGEASKMKRGGRRKIFPPSRALLAYSGAGVYLGCATLGKFGDSWRCIAATRSLRSIRGADAAYVQGALREFKATWRWIEPLFGSGLQPPFQ